MIKDGASYFLYRQEYMQEAIDKGWNKATSKIIQDSYLVLLGTHNKMYKIMVRDHNSHSRQDIKIITY
jgi:hypothetical protein